MTTPGGVCGADTDCVCCGTLISRVKSEAAKGGVGCEPVTDWAAAGGSGKAMRGTSCVSSAATFESLPVFPPARGQTLVLCLLARRAAGLARHVLQFPEGVARGLLGPLRKVLARLAHQPVLHARRGQHEADGSARRQGHSPDGQRVLLQRALVLILHPSRARPEESPSWLKPEALTATCAAESPPRFELIVLHCLLWVIIYVTHYQQQDRRPFPYKPAASHFGRPSRRRARSASNWFESSS